MIITDFWGHDDQKCPLRVLSRFVVWGSKKLFLGGSDKNEFFFCKLLTTANILRILKKISKISKSLPLIQINGKCMVPFYFVCICQKCYIISV